VPLGGIDPPRRDDYVAGISCPLGRYVGPGDHRILVRVLNRGGPGGLDVRVDPRRGAPLAELLAGAAGLLLLVGASMRAARARWSTVVLGAVAVAVRLSYLVATPHVERAHDPLAHLAYVDYLLDHHALPRAHDGYEFYQPPLYYLTAALLEGALRALRFADGAVLGALQLESVACELGFAGFAVATARLWIDRIPACDVGRGLWSLDGLAALCTALLLLWPSSVLHSVRIGNDDLTYLLFGGALYFASRWWLARPEGKRAHFLAAAGFAGLGMLTKTNSVVLFAVLGVLLVARILHDRERRVRVLIAWTAPLALLFVLTAAAALHESVAGALAGQQGNLLVPNTHLNSTALEVGNHARNFLWFDFKTYLGEAFTSPWEDEKGRQFFWNYLVKTSLFGEWTYARTAASDLAVLLSIGCLLLLAVVVVRVLLLRRAQLFDELPMLVTAVLLVSSLALLRMKIPSSCTGDFRYVLPVLLPLAYGYVRGLACLRGRGWRRVATASLAVGWIFAGLSVAFIAVVVVGAFP
jgi:hypothetical protein